MIPENKVKLMWSMYGINKEFASSEILSHQSYMKGELDKSPSITKSLKEFSKGILNIYGGNGSIMNLIYETQIERIKTLSYSIVRDGGYDYFVGIYIELKDNKTIECLTDGTINIK